MNLLRAFILAALALGITQARQTARPQIVDHGSAGTLTEAIDLDAIEASQQAAMQRLQAGAH